MRTVCSLLMVVAAAGALACGVEGRKERQQRAALQEQSERQARTAAFEWPADGPRDVAILRVGGAAEGDIRIALYPELAPATVANFEKLAAQGFYRGTTFHRVIPGFMIQGGDPNSKDEDPSDDGFGGPGYQIEDEFSDAPHERGVVSMAHSGKPNSAGSQFFIIHSDAPHLNGYYTAFGRVIEGMDVVDAITEVERDVSGRWGPRDRPLENVVIEGVEIQRSATVRRITG